MMRMLELCGSKFKPSSSFPRYFPNFVRVALFRATLFVVIIMCEG